MDIEQLKLVLEAAAAAGDSAMTIAVIFMAKEFIIETAWCAMFTTAGIAAFKLFKCHSHLEQIAHAAGTTLPLTSREVVELSRRVSPVREQEMSK